MKQFLRIAKARLKKRFPFKRQRDAVAAKMYVDWIERKENPFGGNLKYFYISPFVPLDIPMDYQLKIPEDRLNIHPATLNQR